MADEKNREQAIERIKDNILRNGFHTYVVSGGDDPHYAYTIGLRQRLGAELVLAGSYFYKLDEIPKIIDGVANQLSSSNLLDVGMVSLSPWGAFSFRSVDESWIKLLMLGALDFYHSEEVRAFQLFPDDSHVTLDVPQMERPWDPELEPAWKWLKQKWPYTIPSQSVAITNLAALRGERTTEVMRWEPDEWEIFAGPGPDVPQEDRRVVPLSVLLATDETLRPVVNLAVGTGLWRDAGLVWHPWGAQSNS